jgi:hypothetical protein
MHIIPRIMTSASADHSFPSHHLYIVYLPMLKQINRWIDPLAEHLITSATLQKNLYHLMNLCTNNRTILQQVLQGQHLCQLSSKHYQW